MTALVIGGILFGVGIPGMTALIRNNRITSQANDFLTSLAKARSEAIKRGVPVVMCKSPEGATPSCASGSGGWETGWGIYADLNSNGSFDSTEPVLLVRGTLGGNNKLTGNNNVANKVTFLPQGVVGAGGIGSFSLTDQRGAPDGLRLICLGMTGRARIFSDGTATCPAD